MKPPKQPQNDRMRGEINLLYSFLVLSIYFIAIYIKSPKAMKHSRLMKNLKKNSRLKYISWKKPSKFTYESVKDINTPFCLGSRVNSSFFSKILTEKTNGLICC